VKESNISLGLNFSGLRLPWVLLLVHTAKSVWYRGHTESVCII